MNFPMGRSRVIAPFAISNVIPGRRFSAGPACGPKLKAVARNP